jgi:nucleoside-diphosphate-sugar epimerase
MKKILVIGGAGYVGSQLVLELLKKNYQVTVYDLMIYGNVFKEKLDNLSLVKGDVRDLNKLKDIVSLNDSIIHLACISNDPSFELNPKLGHEINYSCFEPLIKISKDLGIKRFIYASSSSVYGVKEEKEVNEKSKLEPLTDYSRFKVQCEEVLLKYSDNNFIATILRPATVCGFSIRQRLDLVVNILTNIGYYKKQIKILGGNQLRPNIHIDDMVGAYLHVLETDIQLIKNEIFNVGFENYTVENLAKMVKKNIGEEVKLLYEKTNDNRSYHISSKKISEKLGFLPKKNIEDGIKDLIFAFENKILINTLENENFYNIKKMQSINLS